MAASSAIKRHGGKGYLADKIRALFPKHTRYCETHFGSGAVLLAGDGEGVAEYANDLDKLLMHFWWTLSEPTVFEDFHRRAQMTPFSEPRFNQARERIAAVEHCIARMPQDRAVDFFVQNRQSRQALGKCFATPTGRLRRNMNEQVSAWLSAVDGLPEMHARLRRVEIRCMDAVDFIKELDSPETLFYCDPPYMHETRTATKAYAHEMTKEQHYSLLSTLGEISGKFLLSGYPSDFYEKFAHRFHWRHVDFDIDNKASSAKSKEKKIERVWMNFRA